MPPSLPSPVRAALGLAATMLDEARRIPDRAIELPMRAVSRALAISLRAQQRYAALAARGDEIVAGRGTTDDAPAWATFDDAPSDLSVGSDVPAELDEPVVDAPAPRPRPGKTVRAPRNGKASAFDAVDDESAT